MNNFFEIIAEYKLLSVTAISYEADFEHYVVHFSSQSNYPSGYIWDFQSFWKRNQ